MALTIKGGGKPPPKQPAPANLEQAAAQAFARLKGKRTKKGAAADAVGEVLDDIVGDEDALDSEMAAAKKLLEEASEDLPEGTGLEQAKLIAAKLREKLEATRGQRGPLARKIQGAFDALSDD